MSWSGDQRYEERMLNYIIKNNPVDRLIVYALKDGQSIHGIAESLEMDVTKVLERCRTIQFELIEARRLIKRDDYLTYMDPPTDNEEK